MLKQAKPLLGICGLLAGIFAGISGGYGAVGSYLTKN